MPALAPYAGDNLTHARRWVDLDPAARKRKAIEACRDRDEAVLADLQESYTTLYGKKGARTSLNTQRAYRNAIRSLLEGFAGVSLIHADVDQGSLLVRGWEDKKLAPSTVTVRLAGARALYRALRWAKATVADPFQDVHPAPDPTPADEKRHPYSQSDITRLLEVATGPERLLILLTAHGGLRISEALALTADDIDLSLRQLRVRHGKGDKARTVQLSRTLAEALEGCAGTILPYRNRDAAARAIKKLCTRTGIQWLALHSFRHSCGTRLYAQTGKLEVAQKQLGHQSISTTQVYVAWSDQTVKDAVGNW